MYRSHFVGAIHDFIYFNDKEVPKGNFTERELIHSCECVNNPKGTSAYKNFSIMFTEEKFVANNTASAATRLTDQLQQTLTNFFVLANPSDFLEANNNMLGAFLELGLKDQERYSDRYIQNTVFMLNQQNKFIVELKEIWDILQDCTTLKKQ